MGWCSHLSAGFLLLQFVSSAASFDDLPTYELHRFRLEQLQVRIHALPLSACAIPVCAQFPSAEDLAALRAAVFEVGIFAVVDFEEQPPHASSVGSKGRMGTRNAHAEQNPALAQAAARIAAPVPCSDRWSSPCGSGFGGALRAFASCVHSGQLDGLLLTVPLGGAGGGSGGGVTRTTLATSSRGSVAMPLIPPSPHGSGPEGGPGHLGSAPPGTEPRCPGLDGPAAALRRSADAVGRAYARVLDRLVHGVASARGTVDGTLADSFVAAVVRAESLEHFHLFRALQPANTADKEREEREEDGVDGAEENLDLSQRLGRGVNEAAEQGGGGMGGLSLGSNLADDGDPLRGGAVGGGRGFSSNGGLKSPDGSTGVGGRRAAGGSGSSAAASSRMAAADAPSSRGPTSSLGAPSSSASSRGGAPMQALELHTDLGLFIVMTAAEYVELRGPYEGRGDWGDDEARSVEEDEAPLAGRDAAWSREDEEEPSTQGEQEEAEEEMEDDSGLRLELPSGRVVRPTFPAGCLLVLGGEGTASWMRAAPGSPQPYAAAHEVVLPAAMAPGSGPHGSGSGSGSQSGSGSGVRSRGSIKGLAGGWGALSLRSRRPGPGRRGRELGRAWYGRMYLPPGDAILQRGQLRGSGLTFDEYRRQARSAFLGGRPEAASAAGRLVPVS